MLLLDMMSKGDKLVVWKLDRLARNMNDLTNIVETIGASLEICSGLYLLKVEQH